MKRLLIALASAAVFSAAFAKVTIQQGFEDNTDALAATPTTSALAAMDGDGTAENPYKIATANDLIALMDAVSNNVAARSLNYIQTADIDMASVGPFAGIGKYADNPTAGTPFTGTYDGQGFKISNVTFTDRDYAGIFNQVNGGTIKNLTVENLTFVGTGSKYCASIIGNAGNGATLKNLVATGSFGSAGKPGSHNMAGIAIRLSGGGAGTLVQNCTNNAAIYGTYTKLAGICALTQVKVTGGGAVTFDGCVNNGALTMPSGDTAGRDGLAGIVGYSSDATVLVNCSNTGAISSTLASAKVGELVGYSYAGYTLTDQGGNSGDATKKLVHTQAGTINGFKYATVDNGVATTVTTLAAGNTYLLEGNVAASETPVYTFDAAGTIAFDTALGYTFAGTVAADPNMFDEVSSETVGTVTTYSAVAGTVVATITKSGTTTSYNTLQKALVAAESGDTVNLVAAASGSVTIPAGVTVNVASANLLDAATSLAGEGVLAMGYTVVPSNATLSLCQQPAWEGTLALNSIDITGAIRLTQLGNANSSVRFSNCGCAFVANDTTAHAIKALEVGSGGLYFIGDYSSGTFTFPCALTGTGALTIEAKNSAYGTELKAINFTGDVSGFAGSISFADDANAYVAFGEDTTNAKCIIVSEGSEATIGSAATWTATGGIVVKGTLNVNGNVSATLYGATGTGVVVSTKPGLTKSSFSSYWNGTYVIAWAGANNTAIDFNSYAYSNSKVKIPSGSTLQGYVDVRANNTLTNDVALVVDGELNLSNGYDYSTVVWKKISGSGTVKYAFAPTHWIKEKILSLDGFTGSIEVSATTQLEIDSVNVSASPAAGACVVPMTVTSGGTVGGDLKLFVAGTETGALEYKADGAEGAGLYVASAPAPVVPEVTPSSSGTADCGTADAAAAAAAAINESKATYIKAPAGVESATYSDYFTARADGTSVVVELSAAGTNALEVAATNTAAQVAANLSAIAATETATTVNIAGAQPGFYYSVVYDDNLTTLDTAGTEGTRVLAGTDGSVELPIPAKEENATAGFYRVKVSVSAAE